MGACLAGRGERSGVRGLTVRYMLDSAFVIDHLRGLPEAAERFARLFADGDDPIVNDVVCCEVRAGMRDADLAHLMALLEPVDFIQPDADAALLAGAWRASAHRRGAHLSLPDALIAAAAHAVDAIVLTRNVRDFALTEARVEAY
jgi:predicted nucleic acid-binding protein